MAVSTTSWFNNALQGIPGIGADFDIFETTTVPTYAVGTRFTRSDGCEYVYSHFGTAVTHGGFIVGQDVSESSSVAGTSRLYATASCTAIGGETIKPNTVGSRYIQFLDEGITADMFAGGYFQTWGVAGTQYYQYRIKGNTASVQLTSGASWTCYIELYEPLQRSVDAAQASHCRIVGSPYSNLETCLAGTDSVIGGVTTCSHAASTYGWVQVKGVSMVRGGPSGPALGSVACLSDLDPGCVAWAYPSSNAEHIGRRPIVGYGLSGTIGVLGGTSPSGMAIMLNL